MRNSRSNYEQRWTDSLGSLTWNAASYTRPFKDATTRIKIKLNNHLHWKEPEIPTIAPPRRIFSVEMSALCPVKQHERNALPARDYTSHERNSATEARAPDYWQEKGEIRGAMGRGKHWRGARAPSASSHGTRRAKIHSCLIGALKTPASNQPPDQSVITRFWLCCVTWCKQIISTFSAALISRSYTLT